MIERVQFPLNRPIYEPGGVKIPGSDLSLVDWFLFQHERIDSALRRYQSPDEYPFFPDAVQPAILAPIDYPRLLHPNDVNLNPTIKRQYIEDILPACCANINREPRGEAEENYGSSATCDVSLLQALSRRIHYGKFVAEAKFLAETDRFVKLIKENDIAGIAAAITHSAQEEKVLGRLRLKAATYGTDPDPQCTSELDKPKINVDAVVNMYKVGHPVLTLANSSICSRIFG